MSFLSDFKAFAMRGNVIDMAVGIIIGAAFGTIVSSLVADVIMPPIGLLLGGMDFSDLVVILKKGTQTDPAVVLSYGKFIQHVISFLIIAFSVFVLIKAISRFEDKKTVAPVAPTKDQELLSEIRDLLKEKTSK